MRILAAVAGVAAGDEAILGSFRVQTLSPRLLRIEPVGPKGYENRTTFTVVNRSWRGPAITSHTHTTVSTDHYSVELVSEHLTTPPAPCSQPQPNTAAFDRVNSAKFPNGGAAKDRGNCCAMCASDDTCSGWFYDASVRGGETNCWPTTSFSSLYSPMDNVGIDFAWFARGGGEVPSVVVRNAKGKVVFDTKTDVESSPNLLHWPAPMQKPAYVLVDYPRFHVPEWGPSPMPADVLELRETNGYDFGNDVNGDTYVLLLGDSMDDYHAARQELLDLIGNSPQLPDYAYGTWFTWWHAYSFADATEEVKRWQAGSLPLDVWALDMNWRRTADHMDRFYNHPNTDLFPNFTEWFQFLTHRGLRTYFNDHPFPVAGRNAGGLQTSPEEVAFRYQGLTEWMERGLTTWWFDRNWAFSIPPPFINESYTGCNWKGLSNTGWGSHIYFGTVAHYDKNVRDARGDTFYQRPMTLTKFAPTDWRSGMSSYDHRDSPAQHRFPVWWTGDQVPLLASVESMVTAGLHSLKPYVHSDCGGDFRGGADDLIRWTGHCTFGTILRYHGEDHRPWSYNPQTEATVKKYLDTRYRMLPTILSAGIRASKTGFPMVARGDLYWPGELGSERNDQYVFADDLLVAPTWNTSKTRTVWVPPGDWEDAWTGDRVSGPSHASVSVVAGRIPLFYRGGGLLVLGPHAMRVDDQDWSALTLEAFATSGSSRTQRQIYEREDSEQTSISFDVGQDAAVVSINGPPRKWIVRLHLLPGQSVKRALVDGLAAEALGIAAVTIESQDRPRQDFWVLGGAGTAPAPRAGPVVEVVVPSGGKERTVRMELIGEALV